MNSATQIKIKIRNKIYQLIDIRRAFEKSKRKFQSTVWNSFEAILDEKGETIPNFVCCKYCIDVLKCPVIFGTGKDFGTSNLRRHVANCRAKKKEKNKNRKYLFSDRNKKIWININLFVFGYRK